jgi:demethylmenaquinone methyltransferase/2-methoxy-6-polyprenyl-1,4-benzoquinol methylase
MTRADLTKAPEQVAAMFDGVAQRYDLTNDVLALGQTRIWRKAVVQAVRPKLGERILDLAAGTGTSSTPFVHAGAFVVPTDFSLGMLMVGHDRQPELPFVAGDALRLPFADHSFDAATISFGLRNLVDRDRGLTELIRVVRPGGRLVICEFSQPVWPPFRTLYTEYLMKALPAIAERVASNPDAYIYLAESIRAWPSQQDLAAEMRAAGWQRVQWRNLTGGIVALHRGLRPPESATA